MQTIQWRKNTVETIENCKLIGYGTLPVEVGGDFHGTRSGIVAGIAGGIPKQGSKSVAKPVAPYVRDLAAGINVRASPGRIKPVNDIGGRLRVAQKTKSNQHEQSERAFLISRGNLKSF